MKELMRSYEAAKGSTLQGPEFPPDVDVPSIVTASQEQVRGSLDWVLSRLVPVSTLAQASLECTKNLALEGRAITSDRSLVDLAAGRADVVASIVRLEGIAPVRELEPVRNAALRVLTTAVAIYDGVISAIDGSAALLRSLPVELQRAEVERDLQRGVDRLDLELKSLLEANDAFQPLLVSAMAR